MPTFASGVGVIDVATPISDMHFGCTAVALAVVTFAQAPVQQYRNRAMRKRHLGCLTGASQVGAEHGGDAALPLPASQLKGQLTTPLRKPAVVPSRGHSTLVVLTDGVRLEEDCDRHATTLRSNPSGGSDPAFGVALAQRRGCHSGSPRRGGEASAGRPSRRAVVDA